MSEKRLKDYTADLEEVYSMQPRRVLRQIRATCLADAIKIASETYGGQYLLNDVYFSDFAPYNGNEFPKANKPLTPTSPNWENTPESFLCR